MKGGTNFSGELIMYYSMQRFTFKIASKRKHNDETLVSSSDDEKKEGTSAHYFGVSLFRVKSPCFLIYSKSNLQVL